MSKNSQITQLDTDQIVKQSFDSTNDAQRVYIVGGGDVELSIDSNKIADAVKDSLKDIKITSQWQSPKEQVEKIIYIPQIEIKEIEKPVYIDRIVEIEKIVPRIEYKTIEIPVVTEKIVTIEKPVIMREIVFKEIEVERTYPTILKIAAVIQAISIIGILIFNIIKK